MSGDTVVLLLIVTVGCLLGLCELALRLMIAWSHRRVRVAKRKTAQAEQELGETLIRMMGIEP